MFFSIVDLADSLCIYKIDCDEIDDNVFLNKLNKSKAFEIMAQLLIIFMSMKSISIPVMLMRNDTKNV